MKKPLQLLVVTAFVTVTTATMAPADAQAGGAERLRECLESIDGAADRELARSRCLWKHYEYMASYGR